MNLNTNKLLKESNMKPDAKMVKQDNKQLLTKEPSYSKTKINWKHTWDIALDLKSKKRNDKIWIFFFPSVFVFYAIIGNDFTLYRGKKDRLQRKLILFVRMWGPPLRKCVSFQCVLVGLLDGKGSDIPLNFLNS